MPVVLVKKRRDSRALSQVRMEAEMGITWPQAKECPGAARAPWNWKRQGRNLPQRVWRAHGSAGTLISNIWPLELWENKYLWYFVWQPQETDTEVEMQLRHRGKGISGGGRLRRRDLWAFSAHPRPLVPRILSYLQAMRKEGSEQLCTGVFCIVFLEENCLESAVVTTVPDVWPC